MPSLELAVTDTELGNYRHRVSDVRSLAFLGKLFIKQELSENLENNSFAQH